MVGGSGTEGSKYMTNRSDNGGKGEGKGNNKKEGEWRKMGD